MRKGILFLFLFFVAGLTSCNKQSKTEDAYSDFVNSITEAQSYVLEAQMEVKKDEGSNLFDVEVSYKSPSYYRVNYQNQSSNSRQILLKNSEGVYVLSPELNKEFKFDSTWPLNSSHIYILNKVVEDLSSDTGRTVECKDDYYIFTSAINHKVKHDLVKQSIYVNKNTKKLEKVCYQSADDDVMILTVKSLELNKVLPSDTFKIDAIMQSETSALGEGSSVIVSSINFENIFDVACSSETYDDITVMSYKGDKNYSIIFQKLEDTPSASARIYDDFVMLDDTIAFISTSSLTFYFSDYEFKIVSGTLTLEEMVDVANSLTIA